MLTLKELAKELSVSTKTIYNLIERGMPNIRVGRVYRFKLAAVNEWLKEQ